MSVSTTGNHNLTSLANRAGTIEHTVTEGNISFSPAVSFEDNRVGTGRKNSPLSTTDRIAAIHARQAREMAWALAEEV